MKLLYLTNSRIPTEKARGYQIAKMCEEFAALGLTVELIVPHFNNPVKEDLFSYYQLKKSFTISRKFFIDLRRLNNYWPHFTFFVKQVSFAISLLFAYLFVARTGKIIYTREPLIAIIFKKLGYFTVYEAHFFRPSYGFWFLNQLKKVDRIVANSQGTAAEYSKHGLNHILVCPNGVNAAEFNLNQVKGELRVQLQLPLDKKIIMYLGHFYEWKGIGQIIQAAEILKNDQELLFALVGGSDQDISRYRQLVQELGLSNLTFLGRKNRAAVPQYLKSADLLLLTLEPTSLEASKFTSPIKLFEYLAAKVPVVAANVLSIRNLVSEQEVIFYQPNDPGSLAKIIKQALRQDNHRLVEAGYKLAEKNSWQNRADKIIAFIKKNNNITTC